MNLHITSAEQYIAKKKWQNSATSELPRQNVDFIFSFAFTISSFFLIIVVSMPYYDTATRAQVVAFKSLGLSNQEIEQRTGVKKRTIHSIYNRAIKRGFDLNAEYPTILNTHVEDAPKSGRPSIQEKKKDEVLNKVRTDRYGREKTCAYIASEVGGIGAMTVWKILHKAGFKKTKPTRKPGLT